MDMNLVLIVIFVETIIFVWIIKEGILAITNLNIFDFLIFWINDRPIILPCLIFLIFPFLIFSTVDNSSFLLEKSANTNSLFTWLSTMSTIALTAFGLFLNNRYSEHRKNKKEQKELANILIPIVNGHLLRIKPIKKFQLSTIISNDDIEKIDRYTNGIKNDDIYQSCLLKIGIFESIITNLIIEYHQSIVCFIDEFTDNLERGGINHLSSNFVFKFEDIIDINITKSYLLIMLLSKLVVNDRQKYQETKKLVVKEYFNICKNEKTLSISNNFVVQTNGFHITTLDKKELVELIIFVFKELGILSELKSC